MSEQHSISQWISQLKEGDSQAAQCLWDRYCSRLVELARQKLGGFPRRVADEEDVAQSVFHSMCRGTAEGRFQEIRNRDDLWWLLIAITRQKVVDHMRRETAQKRGRGRVQTEAAFGAAGGSSRAMTLDDLIADEPTPDFVAVLNEEHERLLGLLRVDSLRNVAICRIEGYTVDEIATKEAVSKSTIERKLRLIRNTWRQELEK